MTANNITAAELITAATARVVGRSAWAAGIRAYIPEIIEAVGVPPAGLNRAELRKHLLNGARDWQQASTAGCFLITDEAIAERLAPPSRRAIASSELIESQGLALSQAATAIETVYFHS